MVNYSNRRQSLKRKRSPRRPGRCPFALRQARTSPRGGFTLLEATVALAIIMMLTMIVAQSLVWNLQMRARLASQQAAVELAANVLEEARAMPWKQLDQAWADKQTVPAAMEALLPSGQVAATVEPVKASPMLRRVTVEVRWHHDPSLPVRSVHLATILSNRSAAPAKKSGGSP